MQTKVILTGTFSSGKTTLLNLFQDRVLAGVIGNTFIIPEVAKKILDSRPDLFNKPELQQIILTEQLRREQEAERNNSSLIVCDRGLIDVIVYSKYFGHPQPNISFHYDHIFLLSPEGVPCVYGEQAEMMRRDLHQIFLDVLDEQKLKYRVLVGSIEERYETIESELYGRGIERNQIPWQERR